MARFRGTIQGSRGSASRLGTPRSGITVTANGWEAGIEVYAHADSQGDCFEVYLTPGSNGRGFKVLIGRFRPNEVPRTAAEAGTFKRIA